MPYAKILLVIFLVLASVNTQEGVDGLLTLEERCQKYGFGYEEYQVTTGDGYILTLHRILSGDSQSEERKPPVLMIPLIIASAEMFTNMGPDDSPAFNLVNNGFDVWILNFRGSHYSLQHVELDSDADPEFWKFDLVDLRYDFMAAMIFINDATGFNKIHTYGFGMGGSALEIAMAIEPDFFGERISVAAQVAAPMNLAHTSSLFYVLPASMPGVLEFVENSGISPNSPINGFNDQINRMF